MEKKHELFKRTFKVTLQVNGKYEKTLFVVSYTFAEAMKEAYERAKKMYPLEPVRIINVVMCPLY